MTVEALISAIAQLSAEDRLRLMTSAFRLLNSSERQDYLKEVVLESVEGTDEAGELEQWQKDLLDERLVAAEANPGAGAPWEEVLSRLMKKYESQS